MPADALIHSICDATSPRAPAMIVTIYGDLVMPNGGVMGMATLISLCGRLGFSESLVRTAVSRLVTANRLEGERQGRRSFYRLTQAAREEFSDVSKRLHSPSSTPANWMIHMSPSASALAAASSGKLGRLGGDLFLAPEQRDGPVEAQLTFEVASVSDESALRELAASIWPLDNLAAGYRAFVQRFSVFETGDADISPQQALLLRLLLVHEFRMILLSDPRLPANALPADWPGDKARRLFDALHDALSARAHHAITQLFADMPAFGDDPDSASRPTGL
ncbi:PaaX family transcriptional regulator C-terminal domain-containing protein [Notoacmeibacter sp. MSK16QG-6]|uniref:PaaX family transcriptional regulator n=1 Tax=Notoacmeibacter sp. MSK16QG-6 TaxID=2957982 RepID=UPI0020A10DE9|nr:PaaX family transcriptional regulator C-terminal domain-containing protein [Notoacmeibacter sp. MSK16QG-6]MCP1200883.1 PaaX family transcriptional regulator [Notoacmeibacter sp. MSK16QG-6]